MKKTNIVLLAVFAFCCILAVSCNHESIVTPPQEEPKKEEPIE